MPIPMSESRKIRVMVVDDSLVARSMIIRGLSAHPRLEVVGFAINTLDAKNKIPQCRPDVVTMDVEMPGQSGTDFLKQYLPNNPIPVILVSSLDLKVFDALAVGAIDFVRKPDDQQSSEAFLSALAQKVVMAATARPRPAPSAAAGAGSSMAAPPAGEQPQPGPGDRRAGRLYRRHRGHCGRDEAPAQGHPPHDHRPAYAPRLH